MLKAKAKAFSISLRTKPDHVIWDQNNKKAIVTMWNVDHDNCPFLSEDSKCRIYRDRPLLCQGYPLYIPGFLQEAGSREIGLLDCPNAVKLPFPEGKIFLPPSAVLDRLCTVYGSTVLGALRYDSAGLLVSTYFKEAARRRIISPAIIKKNVVKAILRSEPIGLFEFLQSKYAITSQDVQNNIQTMYGFTITDFLETSLFVQ